MSKPTVAILGSSADRSKFGNKSLRAHQQAGWEVFPVNPRGGEIEGLTAYESIEDVPVDNLNRVSMYLPPAVGIKLLDKIAAKGCEELWLNPGSESPELFNRAVELNLNPIAACSIVDLGLRPSDFPDA
ncbi:CoA-binding protein [Durusdinium trenchii]|uniref:CoA-binding protein n=1 Tax=Durusdinium trenchii TaxID=1381693 RepID=A0ABP0MMN7_9DINO